MWGRELVILHVTCHHHFCWSDAQPWLSCHFNFEKIIPSPKFQNIILMVKESSPANFSFLWGVEQVGSKQNVILSLFLYKMYGKQLKIADFSIIGQICQFQWIETIKYEHYTLNRYHSNTFQWFSNFHRIHWGVRWVILGAHFAKNHHF